MRQKELEFVRLDHFVSCKGIDLISSAAGSIMSDCGTGSVIRTGAIESG